MVFRTSYPSRPGSMRSSRTNEGGAARMRARAVTPSYATSTEKPSISRLLRSAAAYCRWSSTRNSRGGELPFWDMDETYAWAGCEDSDRHDTRCWFNRLLTFVDRCD